MCQRQKRSIVRNKYVFTINEVYEPTQRLSGGVFRASILKGLNCMRSDLVSQKRKCSKTNIQFSVLRTCASHQRHTNDVLICLLSIDTSIESHIYSNVSRCLLNSESNTMPDVEKQHVIYKTFMSLLSTFQKNYD